VLRVKTNHKPEWYHEYRKQPITLFKKTWVWSESEERLYQSLTIGTTLNLCSGYSELGDERIDIDKNVKPSIVADVHYLPFKDRSFDTIIIDPPWYGPGNWMDWIRMSSEMIRVARKRIIMILGNLFYSLPEPFELKDAYILKKVSPQVKHVYVWERSIEELVS